MTGVLNASLIPQSSPEPSLGRGRVALWVLATIATPLLIYILLSSFYIGAWYARSHHQGAPPGWLLGQAMFACVPFASWATVALWWWIHRRRVGFADLFATRGGGATDLALGLAVGAAWVVVYGAFFRLVSFGDMFRLDLPKLASVPASLSAGFCEEFLFRGFVPFVVARAGGRRGWQLTVSALAFGASHVFWGPGGMFWTIVLGASFAAIVLWRRNVWAAVVAHVVLDLCIEPGMITNVLGANMR